MRDEEPAAAELLLRECAALRSERATLLSKLNSTQAAVDAAVQAALLEAEEKVRVEALGKDDEVAHTVAAAEARVREELGLTVSAIEAREAEAIRQGESLREQVELLKIEGKAHKASFTPPPPPPRRLMPSSIVASVHV